jgi:hypothetical protein
LGEVLTGESRRNQVDVADRLEVADIVRDPNVKVVLEYRNSGFVVLAKQSRLVARCLQALLDAADPRKKAGYAKMLGGAGGGRGLKLTHPYDLRKRARRHRRPMAA